MNLNTLVAETKRKVRFLERTGNHYNSERAQRIRTAEVQSTIFVREMLTRLKMSSLRRRKNSSAARRQPA